MDPQIEELRGRLDSLAEERNTIHEAAGEAALDEDQQTRWEQIDAEEAEAREQLTAAEERVARAERVAESRARFGSLQVGNVVQNDDVDVRSLSRGEARDRALKRLESAGKDLRSGSADKVDMLLRQSTTDRDSDLIARRLLLTENDAYRSAFLKAMTSPTPAWTAEEARAVAAMQEFEARAMSHTGTSGGFGVPVLIDPTIVLTGQQSLNPFRRISRVETITTDKWKGVSSAGVSWSWDAEAAEVSDDSPTLAQPEVTAYAARGFVPFSIEIGQDYPGFANEISVLLVEGYDELTSEAFAVGTGSQPQGIVTAIQATAGSTVQHTTAGSFGAVDINKVWAALPDRAKGNATWVMNSDTASKAAFLGDAFGTRTADLASGLSVLRERPVEISSYMPSLTTNTTATNGSIVVGDFRRYLIAERVGMSLELVPHLFGTTNNRPTGQRGYFAFARVGADSIDDGAFRVLENA